MYEYENTIRIQYKGGAIFVPKCVKCGRFVKADDTIQTNETGLRPVPNADCSLCGRTEMIFEGFY